MTTEILDFSHHFTPKNVLFIRFSDLKETNTHLSNITILCIQMCRIEFSGSIDTNLTSIRYEICEFHGIYFRYLPMDIFVRCGSQPTMDILVHTPAARWFKFSRILQVLVSFEEKRSKLISRRQYYNAAPVIIMAGSKNVAYLTWRQ